MPKKSIKYHIVYTPITFSHYPPISVFYMNGVKNLHTLHNFELNVIEMLPEQRLKNLYSLNKLRVNQKITRAWPLSTHVYTGSNYLKAHSCYVFTVTVEFFFLTGLSKQCHIIILSDFLTMKQAYARKQNCFL